MAAVVVVVVVDEKSNGILALLRRLRGNEGFSDASGSNGTLTWLIHLSADGVFFFVAS